MAIGHGLSSIETMSARRLLQKERDETLREYRRTNPAGRTANFDEWFLWGVLTAAATALGTLGADSGVPLEIGTIATGTALGLSKAAPPSTWPRQIRMLMRKEKRGD